MKKLRITVRGISYEVLVEVLEDDEQYVHEASPGGSVPLGNTPAAGKSSRAARRAPASSAARSRTAATDPDTVSAPLASVVQKVFVSVGDDVEAKTPLVLLDAMKMDTYIYAPRSGRIEEVCVAPGDNVQIGMPLLRYRAEA